MFLIGLVFRLLGRLVEGVFQALQLNFLEQAGRCFRVDAELDPGVQQYPLVWQ